MRFANSTSMLSIMLGIGFAVGTIGAASAQTTVRMLATSTGVGAGIVEIAEEFNASQDEIQIEIERVPPADTYMQTLLAQLQGGGGPDMLLTSNGSGLPEGAQRLGATGQLADLSDEPWVASYPQGLMGGFYIEDELYALPLAFTTVGMIYNVDLFAEHGITPPETFDELLALCDTAVAAGKRAVAVNGMTPWYFLQVVAVSTNYASDPDWDRKRASGEASFVTSEGWREAFELVLNMRDRQCFQEGVTAQSSPQVFAELAGSNAFTSVSPAPLIGSVRALNPAINLKMAPFPAHTAEDRVVVGFLNDGVSIRATSELRDEAARFLEYLAQPENIDAFIAVAGGISPYSLSSGDFSEEMSDIEPFVADGRVFEVPHASWTSLAPRNALSVGGSALLAGSITIDQFLADMDAAWE